MLSLLTFLRVDTCGETIQYIDKEPQNHTDNEYDYKNKALHFYGYQATSNWTDRTFAEF